MKLSDIAVLASCVALALSQPLEKRVLVWETVVEQVVQTVEVISTYYVQPSAVHKQKYRHKHSKKRSTTTSATVAPPPPVVKNEPPPPVVTPEVTPPPPPPSVTPEAPPPPPPSVTPEAPPPPPPSVTPEVAPPPPPPSVTPEAAPPPPPPSVTPEAPPPPPVVTPAPPVQSPSVAPQEKYEYSYSFDNQAPAPSVTPKVEPVPAAGGGGGGGACGTVGGKCSGDLTFYEAGLGACGVYNNGDTEAVFALAHGMMGTQSNGNPYCGRTATITANGKSVVATLVDKCMGCDGQSVDLSFFAIDQIMDRGTGRMHNVEWYFND